MADERINVIYTVTATGYREQLKGMTDDNVKLAEAEKKAMDTATKGAEQATVAVKTFRQQIKEATIAYQEAAQKNGEFSKQAIAAQKNVARLKDEFGDFQKRVEAFNPDRKFQVLGQAIRGASAGFQGLVAAQALFGNESKELAKVLIRVQAALALTDSINTLLEMGDTFKNLKAIIIGQVIPALGTLRGALIATGIGALAVGVGILIANWEKFLDLMERVFPGFRKLTGLTKDNTLAIEENIKANQKASDVFRSIIDKRLNLIVDAEQKEIAIAKEKARRETLEVDKEKLDARMTAEYKQAIEDDLQKQITDIQDKYSKERADKREKHLAKELADNKKLFDEKIAYLRKDQDAALKKEEDDKNAKFQAFKESTAIERQLWDQDQEKKKKKIDDDAKIREENIEGAKLTATGLAQVAASMFAFSSNNSVAFAEFQKAIALVNIGTKTAEAVANIIEVATAPSPDNIATGGFLIPGKIIAGIGIVFANIASAVGLLTSTPGAPVFNIPAFAEGVVGYKGKGTGTSDSNLVYISAGESIIKEKSTRAKQKDLEALNTSVIDYDKFIYENYTRPAVERERKKNEGLASNIATAIHLHNSMGEKKIVKAVRETGPVTAKAIERQTQALIANSRKSQFITRRAIK